MDKVVLASLVALLVSWLSGRFLIPLLRIMKFGQIERELGPESHKKKQGTPTMGGLMILAGLLVGSLAFGLMGTGFLLPTLLVVFGGGMIGFLDDFLIIKRRRNEGLKPYQKIIGQVLIAGAVAFWAYNSELLGPEIYLPISGRMWNIGIFYIPLVMFIIIAEMNAVNLTDGLDGLASSVTLVYSAAMVIIFMLLASQAQFMGKAGENENLMAMAVFGAALVGALMGFLRHNSHPAKVFMGDTGSLALGGAVSMLAICSKSILLLPIMGICFVASALSCVLQVGSYKLRHGKRIFKMAPLHHHFELSGMKETYIVSMYTIMTATFCLIALLSYTVVR